MNLRPKSMKVLPLNAPQTRVTEFLFAMVGRFLHFQPLILLAAHSPACRILLEYSKFNQLCPHLTCRMPRVTLPRSALWIHSAPVVCNPRLQSPNTINICTGHVCQTLRIAISVGMSDGQFGWAFRTAVQWFVIWVACQGG